MENTDKHPVRLRRGVRAIELPAGWMEDIRIQH